jgi:hypothetical protein
MPAKPSTHSSLASLKSTPCSNGTLDHFAARLCEICDSAFHDGEYAE